MMICRIGGGIMNNRQLAIYDYVIALAATYPNILNEQVSDTINEYINNTSFSLDEVKKVIKLKFERLKCIISDKNNHIFSKYMVITPQGLLDFLVKNYDYGFLLQQNGKTYRLPLDDDNKLLSSNKIITYNDTRVVNYLKNIYTTLPDFIKKEDDSVGTKLRIASTALYYENWTLKNFKNYIPLTIGSLPDLIELEAGFFEEQEIPYQRYVFMNEKHPTRMHSFIAYQKDDKWYYFEYILKQFRGIHEFSSKEEMESVVLSKLMQLEVTDPTEEIVYLKQYTEEQDKILDLATDLKNRALYNFKVGIDYLKDEESKSIAMNLIRDGMKHWNQYLKLLDKLPNTYDFYHLKPISAPKEGINYYDYVDWVQYQNSISMKSPSWKKAIALLERQNQLYKLVIDDLLFPGTLEEKEDYCVFHPVSLPSNIKIMDTTMKRQEITKLLNKNVFNLAYGSYSVGRSVFTLTNDGKFMQYKGVDPMLIPTKLVCSRVTRYKNLIGDDNTPYALQLIEKDGNKYLRFRAACSLEELQHEKKLSRELQELGFYTPTIVQVGIMPHQATEEFLIPTLDEYLEDYLARVGHSEYINTKEAIEFSRANNKGFRIGQEKKLVDNIFRVTDFEYALKSKDEKRLKDLFEFSLSLDSEKYVNTQTYVIEFAKVLGRQLAILFNNGYYNFEGNRRQDITLNAEICDNKFVNYKQVSSRLQQSIDKLEGVLNRTPEKEAKKERLEAVLQKETLKYYFQFFTFATTIKVLIDSYASAYHRHISTPVIKVFVGSILSSLSDEKREELHAYYENIESFTELMEQVISINKRYSDISGEEGHFFQAISREIYEAAKNPTQIIQDATKILDEQNFINQALNMSKEDRFVTYLKRMITEKSLLFDSPMFLNNAYDGNRMGLLIKKDSIYDSALKELVTLKIPTEQEFYKMASNLVQERYVKDPILLHKLKAEKQKYIEVEVLGDVITFDEKGDAINYVAPTPAPAVTGLSNPVFIFLLLGGSSCVLLGILLSVFSQG